MCHQSVGLIARHIEATLGVPTVSLSCARSITEAVRPPRAVYTDYPLGRTAGPPHDPTRQREIVGGALELAVAMTTPGEIIDTPFRWSDDDSWKHNPMGSGGGSGGERTDTRNERVPTPQYQTAEDEELAAARSYDEQCQVCIGITPPG